MSSLYTYLCDSTEQMELYEAIQFWGIFMGFDHSKIPLCEYLGHYATATLRLYAICHFYLMHGKTNSREAGAS